MEQVLIGGQVAVVEIVELKIDLEAVDVPLDEEARDLVNLIKIVAIESDDAFRQILFEGCLPEGILEADRGQVLDLDHLTRLL